MTAKLRAAAKDLPTASKQGSGYSRENFTHWINADGDCQNTRSEVLRAETKAAVTGRFAVSKGKWFLPLRPQGLDQRRRPGHRPHGSARGGHFQQFYDIF